MNASRWVYRVALTLEQPAHRHLVLTAMEWHGMALFINISPMIVSCMPEIAGVKHYTLSTMRPLYAMINHRYI